jgi:hypothetical protein
MPTLLTPPLHGGGYTEYVARTARRRRISRRGLLAASTVASAVAGLPWSSALAQGSYPSQPVRLVVPYAPSGSSLAAWSKS